MNERRNRFVWKKVKKRRTQWHGDFDNETPFVQRLVFEDVLLNSLP